MKRKCITALLLAAGLLMGSRTEAYAMSEAEVMELSEEIGEEYNICPELLTAIAYHESRYEETAENQGCFGLMQIAEKWHRDRMEKLGVTDLNDPRQNMLVAADYIHELCREYEDVGMVLMVYNGDSRAGEYWNTGKGLSAYAENIVEMSEKLERKNEK